MWVVATNVQFIGAVLRLGKEWRSMVLLVNYLS